MAKNIKESRRQSVKKQITQKLDESQAKFKEEYERQLAETIPSNVAESDAAIKEDVSILPDMGKDEMPNIVNNKEEKEMAKQLNFEDDQKDFGAGAVNESTQLADDKLPEIPDDAGEAEKKAEQEKGSAGDDKATTGKYEDDLSQLASDNIANFSNIQAEASAVASLLKNNMFIKQFITNATFGRGFALRKQKDDKGGETAHFMIENMKPGRAKSVVVTVPRKLQEVLTASSKKSMKSLRTQILDATNNGQLTQEEKADTVDMVMGYDDLMVRVANLMEGQIAEFGGKGGELDAGITVKYGKKAGEEEFVATDLTAKQAVEIVAGKNHIIYTMKQPNSALMAKAVQGEALGEKDKKTIKRYRDGKTPLKRTQGAFSALYTDKNFTSISKFDVVTPFGATPITKEQAVRLSARAAYGLKNKAEGVKMESYDTAMFSKDAAVAAVFDPSVPAAERLETLQVAKGYQAKNADGTVKTQKRRKLDANGKTVMDANNKPVYEAVEVKAHDVKLNDRTIKNYYTGKPLTAEEAGKAGFVMYGEESVSKKNTPVAPRVRKSKLAFVGLDVEVDEKKGVVATYGLDDASVSSFVKLVGEEVAKEAFIKAASRNSRGADTTASSEYEDGMLAALLAGTNV